MRQSPLQHLDALMGRDAGGAPQESDESCGPQFRSAFPEGLKAATQLGTAESDDSVGAWNGPVHSGAPVKVHKPCAWNSG